MLLSTCCLTLGFVVYRTLGDQPEDVEEQVRIFTSHFFYFHVFSLTFTCSYFSYSLYYNIFSSINLQIRMMCYEYISNPNAIILAVTAANQDLGSYYINLELLIVKFHEFLPQQAMNVL